MFRARAPRFAAALFVAAIAILVRVGYQVRLGPTGAEEGAGSWHAFDPDSLYHVRRVARALDEGRVAARDPLLAWPQYRDGAGAPIPWPPLYDAGLAASLRPFVPGQDGARAYVERWVCTAPMLFAALTAAVLAWAVARLAGVGAGLAAGLMQALSFASVRYSYWGMGDHHAAVTALTVLLAACLGRALEPRQLDSVPGSLRRGLVAGALIAALLGTWVAALPQVLLLSFYPALLLLGARRHRKGLAALGLGMHASAVALLAPVVLQSPWPATELLALSWLHLAVLLPGAACLAWSSRRAEPAAGDVLVPIGLFALLGLVSGWGAGAWRWASGTDAFMATIAESQPLDGWGGVSKWLGYGVWLLPLAWLLALRALGQGRAGLAPWLLLALPAGIMACFQQRFAEALAPVLAVLLAWSGAVLLRPRLGRWAGVALVALTLALQPGTLRGAVQGWRRGIQPVASAELERKRGLVELLQRSAQVWPGAMLAQWDLGHAVEWFAGRPTVATNFGSYLSPEGFVAPWEVFLAEDPERARMRLDELDVELVLVTSHFAKNLASMVRAIHPDSGEDWLGTGSEPRWKGALGARLVGHSGASPGSGIGFLRQVLVSAPEHRDRTDFARSVGLDLPPVGRVYQRVRGAAVTLLAKPNDRLVVSLRVSFPGEALVWTAESTAEAHGPLAVRVPYATDFPAGEGRLDGPVTWRRIRNGEVLDSGEVVIPETAVREGGTVRIP